MIVVVLLFIFLGVSWMMNREYYSHGGGAVMVLLYIGPIVILNMFALVYYMVILFSLAHRGQEATLQLKKCKRVYVTQLLLSLIAIVIL